MDFPDRIIPPVVLSSWSGFSVGPALVALTGAVMAAPADLTWVSKLAMYIPIRVPFRYPVKRVFWVGGAGAAGGTSDLGIYTVSGTRIYSTGLTTGTANAPKYVTPTAFVLDPGTYYLAFSSTVTTTCVYGTSSLTAETGRLAGVLQEDLSAGSGALPASATFATLTNTLFPIIGVTSSLY